jgi:hypothetical protein
MGPTPEAQPQPQTTVTITLPAELATAIEQDRLATRVRDAGGNVITLNGTVQEQVLYQLSKPGQYFHLVLQRYPPAAIKAAQEATTAAIQAADAVMRNSLVDPKQKTDGSSGGRGGK